MNENRPTLKMKVADISIIKKEIISEIIERPNIKLSKNLSIIEKPDENVIEKVKVKNIVNIEVEQSLATLENSNKVILGKTIIPPYKKFKQIHKRLQLKCPEVITYKPSKVFAIGIHKEIAKLLDISVTDAKIFCKYYCNIDYQRLLIEGAERFNLNNEVTDTVTEEQVIRAKAFVDFKEKSKQIITDTEVEITPIKIEDIIL